jgi:hypothetical protein
VFLRDELKLELSPSKTLITHAASQPARFLGYEIKAQHADTKIARGRRSVNGVIGLFVPQPVIRQKCALYTSKGRPAARGGLIRDQDFTIVAKYQAEYTGLVQYYLLAQDVFRLGRLHWIMETSLLKTLAAKHRSTVTKMARRYKATIETLHGPRTCLQVSVERDRGRRPLVARFGGLPLRRQRTAAPLDQRPVLASAKRNELIHRLLAERCEICTTRENLEVHHIRKLADLNRPGRPEKARLDAPHGETTTEDPGHLPPLPRGHPRGTAHRLPTALITGEQGARKPARPVREEADGKGPEPRAPRRRPTSLGGRAQETDPGQPGHRARARPNGSDTRRRSCPTPEIADRCWSAALAEFLNPTPPPSSRSCFFAEHVIATTVESHPPTRRPPPTDSTHAPRAG